MEPVKKICLLMSFSAATVSMVAVLPEGEYAITKTPQAHYVYAPSYGKKMAGMERYYDTVLASYANAFGYILDAPPFVVLASQENQIANAYATQIPFNLLRK